jgi:hypothetical protein
VAAGGEIMAAVAARQQLVAGTKTRALARALEAEQAGQHQLHSRLGLQDRVRARAGGRAAQIKQEGTLWRAKLKLVEGRYGQNAATTWKFFRFLFFLNCFLAGLWFVGVVLPFLGRPPPTFSWDIFLQEGETDLLQARGLGATFFLYGGYSCTDCSGFGKHWHVDLAFPFFYFLTYLVSFIWAVKLAISGAKDGILKMSGGQPFARTVFSSWDFRVSSIEASRNMRKGIRIQLEELLGGVGFELSLKGLRRVFASPRRAIVVFVLWPLLLFCCCTAAHFLALYEEDLSSFFGGLRYVQLLLLVILLTVARVANNILVEAGCWPSSLKLEVYTVKLFFLRVLVVSTFLYKLYDNTSSSDGGAAELCKPNLAGMKAYTLLVTHVFTSNALHLVAAYIRKNTKNHWKVDVGDLVTDAILNQCIVWIGVLYAPLLPLLGAAFFAITFHAKAYVVLRYSVSSTTVYSPTRFNALVHGLFLLSMLIITVPLSHIMRSEHHFCGPHVGTTMADAVTESIGKGPTAFLTILSWLFHPVTLCSVGGLIFMVNRFKHGKSKQEKRSKEASRMELKDLRKLAQV